MRNLPSVTLVAPLLITTTLFSNAAGFQLQERSSAGLGRAYSGAAAMAEDPSSMATNAANMLLLEGSQFSTGAAYISPSSEVSGSAGAFPTTDHGPAQEALVPYAFISHHLNDDVSVGLALHSRFGLSTDYSDSFLATPLANKSEIITSYLSPKAALKLNKNWNIGGGVDIIHTEGELTNSLPNSAGGSQFSKIIGEDWSYGFNLGSSYQLSPKTRIGIAYYSKVDLKLKGNVSTQTGLPLAPPVAPGSSVDAFVENELPASTELAVYHELTPQWALHGSLTWTGWSCFEELTVETNNGTLSTVDESWKDVYRIAIGGTYKHSDKWTFRTGAAFDESPVRSSDFRTLRIPDSDRYWLSLGATYTINEHYSIDCAYSRIFARTVHISDTNALGSFSGKASGSVDILGISLNGKF